MDASDREYMSAGEAAAEGSGGGIKAKRDGRRQQERRKAVYSF
jgi:hypothetical protein